MNVTAETFKPAFRNDVTVQVAGKVAQVNPEYCLSEESAFELQQLLTDQGKPSRIIQGHPMDIHGGAAASSTVAYLQFLDGPDGNPGTKVSAGIIAAYWAHQTWNVALRYAIAEIEGEAKNQGFSS